MSLIKFDQLLNYHFLVRIYASLSVVYVFFFTITASILPEDISKSRESFSEGQPADFLGTFAGLLYFIIPEWPFGWARNLVFLQVTISLIGLIALIPLRSCSRRHLIWLLIILQYFVAVFSSQQSRDGTLFALVLFGLGIIRYAFDKNLPGWILPSIGTFTVILGLTFRPALSFSAVLFLVFMWTVMKRKDNKSFRFATLLLISGLLVVLPTSIELGLTRQLVKQSNYPLQTVIMQDLGFAACQSANSRTINRSVEILSVLAMDAEYSHRLCQFYRVYTWQSLPGWIAPSSITNGLQPPIRLAKSSDEFSSILNGWVSLLKMDPKTYIQGKLVSLTQVMFSSQSKIWSHASSSSTMPLSDRFINFMKRIGYFLYFPWSTFSTMYLLSPGAILFFCLVLNPIVSRKCDLSLKILSLIPLILVSTLISNIIFFVSDNARYTSSFLILVFVAYALLFSRRDTIAK